MKIRKSSNKLYSFDTGFTLVELLIVIAIIGILAGIIVPRVTNLVGSGQSEADQAELGTVQNAMDTMMVKSGLTAVTAMGTAINNMAAFPDSTHPLYPVYLRSATTQGTYTCSSSGKVTQASTGTGSGGGSSPPPTGGGGGGSTTDTYFSDTASLTTEPLASAPSLPIDASLYTWVNAQIISSKPSPWTNLSGANWISTTSANSGAENPNEGDAWRLFKTTFDVSSDLNATQTKIYVAADNAFEIYLNGTRIATSADFSPSAPVYGAWPASGTTLPFTSVWSYDISPANGPNTVVFVVRNWDNGGGANPTGLIYKVTVTHP